MVSGRSVVERVRQSRRRLQSRSEDALRFLARLRNARMVGAVAPSGKALARRIVSGINPARGPVLEVGAGTGVFTAALLARGVAPEALTAVEADPVFAALLRARFPDVEIVEGRAEDALGAGGPLADRRYADAVSGLPLLNFPPALRRRILEAIFARLAEDGALYQFTYGPRAPLGRGGLAALGLAAEPVGRVWRNLPPATVYRIRRAV
ncbi:class I SAM-dependent methyltransferase [Sphingosinicella microcystinivorans]|uniref:class I SAM-dependent methyltransferase n=1 Tax=Sphingosinicella microcystinivorans TaxID=335406 RepID=UPI0022F3AAC1|nr:methyltransferase domain-containing protein [Sphingosinicella microcystinivorans]WBX86012.1 methyltransferase domain-containing protein [Sphingosinicella microcystinivorans]